MDMENQESGGVLVNTIITKLEQHDKQIQGQEIRLDAVQKKMDQVPDPSPGILEIKKGLSTLSTNLQQMQFPADKVKDLGNLLSTAVALLRQPVQPQVHHHHHFPKVVWLTVGLFLSVCFLSLGWTMTGSKLADYRANDTKYRKLKLVADSAFLVYLYKLDSLYRADPDSLRDAVIKEEQLNQERLELTDRIQAVDRKLGQSDPNAGRSKPK